MIENLIVENYRSIINQNIRLTPLTVIIGANGSGKSNLIKCLEFIGDLSIDGLKSSIRARGGYAEILPKAITKEKLYDHPCSIKLDILAPYEEKTKEGNKKIDFQCHYELTFAQNTDDKIIIKHEQVVFNDILRIASMEKGNKNLFEEKSFFSIEVNDKKKITFSPIITPENIDLYEAIVHDFLRSPEKMEKNDKNFKKRRYLLKLTLMIFLRPYGFTSKGGDQQKLNLQTLSVVEDYYDTIFSTLLGFAFPPFYSLDNAIKEINRYDLLIHELRSEQKFRSPDILWKDGSNLPSVLRNMKENNSESFNRILDTLSQISPNISNVKPGSLQTNKEFVEFEEIFGGRTIESWESSDGTLRATGILVALETQRPGATVLIEEPEVGLHPWAIKPLMDHIRQLIEERSLQVILTTHSDQVLES